MENNELYGLICFNALIRNGDKAPSYIAEKFEIIGEGKQAFAHLDIFNKGYVMGYCHRWGVIIPPEWHENVEHELDAYEKLKQQGVIQ